MAMCPLCLRSVAPGALCLGCCDQQIQTKTGDWERRKSTFAKLGFALRAIGFTTLPKRGRGLCRKRMRVFGWTSGVPRWDNNPWPRLP